MKNLPVTSLNKVELINLSGGGPIQDFLDWEIRTKFSFYRGVWDGLMGNEWAV